MYKVTQVNCAGIFPIISLPIKKVQASIYVHPSINDLKKPLIGSFDRQWEGSLKWGEVKELWNIKAFLKLKLQTGGGKCSKCTWPFIHHLHLKPQKITSTAPENQSGFLVLLTVPESDTTVSHQFHQATTAEFSEVVDRDLGYSQNQMLRKEQIFFWSMISLLKSAKHSSLGMYQWWSSSALAFT